MLNNDFIGLKTRLNNIYQEIDQLYETIVIELSPLEKHFNVGDTAYLMYNTYLVEKVKITDVIDFSKNNSPGYIYYYYEMDDVTTWERFKLKLNFYYWLTIKRFTKNKAYFPDSRFGSGHGELAGRGNVLFKTKRQAELDYYFHSLLSSIDDFKLLFF